jgi:DNA-binding MarR family transcriptional regulator
LDRLIHEQGRLGIMTALASAHSLTFKEIRDLLKMTDGNLSVHMRTLEEHGYVNVHKDFVDRKPRSTYSLTEAGRRAFEEYIEALEAIIQQSRAAEPARRRRRSGLPAPLPTPAAE